MVMFISSAEKLDLQAYEIFEALDLQDENDEYFKEKSKEIPTEVLVSLRDKRSGFEGRTLLHNAARSGALAAVLHLIRLGHSVTCYDSSQTLVTPLMDAIKYNRIEIAIVLVEHGADLTTQDINGENALHYAARSNSSRMIKFLIKAAGFSVDQCKAVASVTNVKRKFPEDLCKGSVTREILENFRKLGHHSSIFKKRR